MIQLELSIIFNNGEKIMKKSILLLGIGFLGLCGQISAMQTQSLISDDVKDKLIEQAKRGDIEGFQRIIQRYRLNPHEAMNVNFHNLTPLNSSAINGHKMFIAFAIKNGANIDAQTGRGQTALILAAMEGHEEVIKTLVFYGADKSLVDDFGRDALWYVTYRYNQIKKLLT